MLLFFFAFIYPFVLENARMFETVASYGLVRILPIPKSVRFFEMLFFSVAAVYVLVKTFPSKNRFFSWKDLLAIFSSLIIGVFVSILNDNFRGTPFIVRFQVLWLLIIPYFIFYVFYFLEYSHRFFKACLNSLFFLGFLNALVGVFQFYFLGLMGDDVNGGMQDAHTFGNMMLLLILGVIIIKKLRKYFFIILVPLISFVGASSQKSYVVFLFLLFVFILAFADVKTKVIFIVSIMVTASLAVNFVIQNDPQIVDRFLALADFGIKNSGIGQSYSDIIDIHERYIFSYPFGLGIGSYANPVNYPSFLGDVDVPVSALFREKINNYGVITAFDMQVTYVSFLFIEIGCIGFFFIARFYYKILRSLIQKFRNEVNHIALFTAFGLLVPIISSLFTLLYSMEQISLIYPLMAMAGMLCQTVSTKDQVRIFS